MTSLRRDALTFAPSQATLIDPYLPSPSPSRTKPFVTITYAISLDSSLALSPGVQTALSGPESKAMTHYLRSKHDAILIGVGTAIADNPSLNCRIQGVGGYGGQGLSGQPRPVVVDPNGRWDVREDRKVFELAKQGKGKAPWIVTCGGQRSNRALQALEDAGGEFLSIPYEPLEDSRLRMDWSRILAELGAKGIESVMIEGGGTVINDLLSPRFFCLVDSVVVTIAPIWLGKGGVAVSPEERRDERANKLPVGRLSNVRWVALGEDVVLCGRPSLLPSIG